MAELDKIPVKNTIQVETVKLDDETLDSIKKLQEKSNNLVVSCGNLYLRKKELLAELDKIENSLKIAENEFEAAQIKLNEIGESVDDKYPQARINIQDGTVTYQPGAPSRRQQMMQQSQMKDLEMSGNGEPTIVKD